MYYPNITLCSICVLVFPSTPTTGRGKFESCQRQVERGSICVTGIAFTLTCLRIEPCNKD